MRRCLSWAVVAAIGAVALAAVIDAFIGAAGSSSREAAAPRTQRPHTAPASQPVPPCADRQLTFGVEIVDGGSIAVLQHVQGSECQAVDADVDVRVHSRAGRTDGIVFGPFGNLGGAWSPGEEQRVIFRYRRACSERGPFLAVVTSGSHSARRRIPVEPRCLPDVQRGVIRLEAGADEAYVPVWAPDPATHTFTVRRSMPGGAVAALLRIRPSLELSLHRRFSGDCRRRGAKETCLFHYPLLPAESSGRWVLYVRKSSPEPASVRFRIAFETVR